MENELNSWALDFEDTVYRLLKVYMESKESGIKVTQDEESVGTPTFPTLLVKQIGGTEAGRTNESNTINAIRPTFQITITNKGKRENIIPDFTYGMEFAGTREFKFTLDTDSEEKQVYVDDNGIYMGTVVEDTSSIYSIFLCKLTGKYRAIISVNLLTLFIPAICVKTVLDI